MPEKPEEILKLFSKSEELLEMFRKGKAFTEELMAENERLRYRIVQLEKEKMDLSGALMREIERLKLENAELTQKVEFLSRRFQEVEAENKDFAQRYIEVEEQNESLANLYVASYRLHSTLDPAEVVQCISEILINMVGSEEFGLFLVDDETSELVLAGYEGDVVGRLGRDRISFGDGLEGVTAQTGEAFFAEGDQIAACIPLKIKERVVGVIALYKLLAHKRALTPLDHKLLELLAGHAATALVSSKLYAAADRKLRTIESFMSLLRVK
jgi:nitrate/nitrite-specific signal transduction histidine kinase